ncbi:MAG: MG2 domain-containing protein [Bacteroidota bacterium]
MKKRSIVILSLGVAVLLSVVIIFAVKGNKHVFKRVNPAFKQYVQGFTSGVVSTHASVKIKLNEDFVDTSLFNTPVEKEMFAFSPAIRGKAYWLDARTIEFRPDEKLPAKQFYDAKFFLSNLMKVPDSLKTLEFQFQTMSQDFDLKVENHKAYSQNDLTKERLYGYVKTADIAEEAKFAKLLSASQDGKNLHITWTHDAKKLMHFFQVDSVARGSSKSYVTLKWDGAAIDAEQKNQQDFEIPPLGEFKYMGHRVVNGAEPYVLVQFSNPLLSDQNLDGLIKLGSKIDLRYVIEDNELKIYFTDFPSNNQMLTIEPSLKSSTGTPINNLVSENIQFDNTKPNVRFVGSGNIMPSSNGMLLPIEAVNLNAIDIKVMKIYESNVLQFFQVNDYNGQSELTRVGKVVLKKTIPLTKVADYNKWNKYSLDLSELIKPEPGAIYSIRISFKKKYSTYPCNGDVSENEPELTTWESVNENEDGNDYYYNDSYDDEYGEDGYYYYRWEDRDNPCKATYYNNKYQVKNVLASDLGIIAKGGADGTFNAYVTDIISTKPMSGVTVEFFDFQQQLLSSSETDGDGMVVAKMKRKPFMVIAKKDKQRAYLKLFDGACLSLSMFDVGGAVVQKGIKGFIYGERGVWRPGDSLYLTFILEDKLKTLPETHPVTFTLTNPSGQIVRHIIKTSSVNGFYDFRTNTDRSAPTGNWIAKVKVGGVEFQKTIKIETVKPNRLKLNINFNTDKLVKDKIPPATLDVKWLTGAVAKNLKTSIFLTLTKSSTTFKKYADYVFDNPTSGFKSESINVFDGKLDENGKVTFTPQINFATVAPGVLKANFETMVFEDGGDFSVDRFSMPYYPFQSYVGLAVPKNNDGDRMLYTDKTYNMNLVNLDANGNPIPSNTLKVQVYKLEWRWWWDDSGENSNADYVSSSYSRLVDSSTVKSSGGRATFPFTAKHDEWGRYFLKVTDLASGHITGKIIYADWPGYSRGSGNEKQAATMLTFTADKEKYTVGDNVKLAIPSSSGGRALLTIESGSKVLESHWVTTDATTTEFSFKVTPEMAPNCFAYVTLIQPHAQAINDLPVRMYGVIPIAVEDPNTHLKAAIIMKDVLVPEQTASITVKEETGKPMTYTLAVVDEGLLDLTRFKTPDPWSVFYAKEALGIKTWDIFDLVMGAFSGELQRILSIGGDGEGDGKGNLKANRFIPMVKFLGPFELGKGQSKTHTFKMPQYIGSVRVMVVAGQNAAYGNAEKTVAVRKPLMVLGTLPRVVGPGETVKLPVSVFAMEKNVKNVSVQVIPDNMFTLSGKGTQQITFKKPGDEMLFYELKVKEAIGVGKIKIVAISGNETATHNIEIDVRNPNPKVTDVIETVIQPGKTWNTAYAPIGMTGTNKGVLEISSIPPLNLESRLSYLMEYPHGCIEQTTSSVFPQLYLSGVLDLNQAQKQRTEQNIKAGIQRIKLFQLGNGGLGYWQGAQYADDWGTNYAGHFILEAELKGYALPFGFVSNWKKYQKQKAVSWAVNATYFNDDLVQSYRLYTLALAKSPEMGAMNKLLEYKGLSLAARWRLAAAYQLAGKPEVAKRLISTATTYIKPYRELYYTYGSDVRDKAMIIETLCLMDQKVKAAPLVKELSSQLSKNDWYSTQSTAYALLAITKFTGGGNGVGINVSYTLNKGTIQQKTTTKSIYREDLTFPVGKGKVVLNNNGKNMLYARIILQGIPAKGDNTGSQNNLRLTVTYKTMNNQKLNPDNISQGTNFIAEVVISNPGSRGIYRQLALTQIFPSGWEIFNARMSELAKDVAASNGFTYQDVRDDRVYTYFDLNPNQSKTFKIMLNSSYLGKFYLPTVYCEAMYDNTINARFPGKWVEVSQSK